MTTADPDRSCIQSPGAFMGKGRTMQSRADSDSLLPKNFCRLLAVQAAAEGYRRRLMGAGKHLEAQLFQAGNATLQLPVSLRKMDSVPRS